MSRWQPNLRSRFNDFDMDILIGIELSRCSLELLESEIPNAGKGIFTTIYLGPYHVVATYCGTFVHKNLSVGASHRLYVYREGDLAVPDKGFLKWGVKLDLQTPSGRPIWVFPAFFFSACFLNNPSYTKTKERRPFAE